MQREATRLSGSGLIRERRVGRSRLISANPASRYTRPLTELVSLAFGPQFVIGEEFRALGATAVAIYGSWAARYEGSTGHAPNDVDVLVIGDVPRRDMYEGGTTYPSTSHQKRATRSGSAQSKVTWICLTDAIGPP